MRINEIFHSLQGEGVYSLIPMTFVRLQGCNLNCAYCDTKRAQSTIGGSSESPSAVLRVIESHRGVRPCDWVCITGGEPLLQSDELGILVKDIRLKLRNDVEVETNGCLPPPGWFWYVSSWVVDVKCPSSGAESKWDLWKSRMREQDQVKFVVSDAIDLNFVRRWLASNKLFRGTKLVSPVQPASDGLLDAVTNFCLERNLRLNL